jgi:ferredoxin
MKAHVNRDVCVGSAICVQIAPEAFELGDDGKSRVVDASAVDEDTLREAVRNCPVQAIVIDEE